MSRTSRFRFGFSCLLAAIGFAWASNASAFVHVVSEGETLASIAERFYGKLQNEKLLVAANALDRQGGSPIVAGMRLEVPAVWHYRVRQNESWDELATRFLGARHRSVVLSQANSSSPWLVPDEGAEIVVPYNLTLIVNRDESIVSLALRYLGDSNKAWMLTQYNRIHDPMVKRGVVLLLPLTDLALTEAGKVAADAAATMLSSQADGEVRSVQRVVESELPTLIADVRQARYVDAIRRGNSFLSQGELTKAQMAVIHRQLLEAYAALDATGLAAGECAAWKLNDPAFDLDPVYLSPKIINACKRGSK